MNASKRRNLLPIVLSALFFFLAMTTALLGSSVYKSVTNAAQSSTNQRTALSYLSNQLHRSDVPGGIQFRADQLLLRSSSDDPYVTILYCYDGQLKELYTEAALLSEFSPADGTSIMPLDTLSVYAQKDSLTLYANIDTVTLTPHCGFSEVQSET
ncbi:MAG: DUF4860 domain-containing protein [Evtepia sp.]